MTRRTISNGIRYQYKALIIALGFLIIVGTNVGVGQSIVNSDVLVGQKASVVDALAWTSAIGLVGAIFGFTLLRLAHSYLLFVVFVSLIVGVGLFETASVLLFLASSWSLGVLSLGRLLANQRLASISTTEALMVGGTVWLAMWRGMLHFVVNYQLLHIALCLLPILLLAKRSSEIRDEVLTRSVGVQDWARAIPFWAWVLGIVVIGWVLRWASYPSLGFDDHALHLRVWTELLSKHRYSFDVSAQFFSLIPITVDALHAGLSLMAGSDARGAMNLGFAILLLVLMARIFRTWKLPPWVQWLLMVLMASTPMLGWLLLSLHAELMLAVIALAGMQLVIAAPDGRRGQHLLGVLASAALCVSIKLPGIVLGVTLLAALIVRWWNQGETATPTGYMFGWPAPVLLIPLGFVALHSYGVAWKATGNPVFPFYNAVFRSPMWDPVNFVDERWIHGFTVTSYVRAFFHTSEFFESGDYIAGWQYLFILPIAILVLLQSGTPGGLRLILIPLLGFGGVMFASTQYWRYLFPVMPLAGVLAGSLFVQQRLMIRVMAAFLCVVCIATNLVFFNRVFWMMKSPAGLAFTQDGKERLYNSGAPAYVLTKIVNVLALGSRVLYDQTWPYGGLLYGTPLYLNWYQPSTLAAFNLAGDVDGLRRFFATERIDFAILEMSTSADDRRGLLREYMSKYAYVEGQSSGLLLYRISNMPLRYSKVFDLQEGIRTASGAVEVLLPVTAQGATAQIDPQVLAIIPILRAKQARYSVQFTCLSKNGFFVAQVNWDKGSPYYRLVPCDATMVSFAEAIPVPVGASKGEVYITSRDTAQIQVRDITVEVN